MLIKKEFNTKEEAELFFNSLTDFDFIQNFITHLPQDWIILSPYTIENEIPEMPENVVEIEQKQIYPAPVQGLEGRKETIEKPIKAERKD